MSFIVTILIKLLYFSSPDIFADEIPDSPQGINRIDPRDLKRHLTTLSSDAFEGREAGSRGGKAALGYIRSELKSLRNFSMIPRESLQEFGHEYQNLLILLPGSDERLQHEVIVVGAHYDHVGYGNAKNSAGPIGQIHNGADDNASGTSVLLELIKAFGSLKTPPSRSILFAFWDGEEAGLLGSKHWVAHPTIPLSEIRFALNLDMLGRLREGRIVSVGWRSAPGLRFLVASQNTTNELKVTFQPRVIADSDHYHFYAAGIPVLHFDTDKHEDYHRPSDDPEKINWEGLLLISQFAYRIIQEAATCPDFPRFRREALNENIPSWLTARSSTSSPVRFGVNWDAKLSKDNVAQIAQITPNSPADIAGLRVGDRVIQLGSWMNGTFADLKTTIQVVTNPVPIQIERPGHKTKIHLQASFWGTPIRLGASWIEDPAIPYAVAITQVITDSPADRAGILVGDILFEMDGQPISTSEDFRQRVIKQHGKTRLRIERQGRIQEAEVNFID